VWKVIQKQKCVEGSSYHQQRCKIDKLHIIMYLHVFKLVAKLLIHIVGEQFICPFFRDF